MIYFEPGDFVKYVYAYDGAERTKDQMLWKTAVVVEVVDFGYEILCEGKVINVSNVDLKRLND